MTGFFINRGYPQQIIQQALNRVAVAQREAIISEPVDAVVAQPTIPLVLTYHPNNTLVKSILTSNLHLLRNDPDITAIFQPLRILSAYRRDGNLRDSLVRSTLNSTTVVDDDRGAFPCGRSRCNTCTFTNVSAFVDSHGGRITINDKFTCTSNNQTTWSMSSNAVFVTNYILARPVDVWETDFVNIYLQLELLTRTSQLHGISHHMDTPLRTCLFPQSGQASKAPWTGVVLRPNSYLNTGIYIQVASILTFILFKTLKSARASYVT